MAETDDPKALKEYRSKLRTKVTTAANTLTRKLQYSKDINELDDDHDNLHKIYDEFTVCQIAFEELIASDDERYESYKTVGGLDLQSYEQTVREVYDKAVKLYHESKDKLTQSLLQNEAKSIISKSKTVLTDLHTIASKEEVSADYVAYVRTVLDEASVALDCAKNFSCKISTIFSLSDILDSVNYCVCDLDATCYKVRQLLCICESSGICMSERFSSAATRASPSSASPTSASGPGRLPLRSPAASTGVANQHLKVNGVQAVGNGPTTFHNIHEQTSRHETNRARNTSVTAAYNSPMRENSIHSHSSTSRHNMHIDINTNELYTSKNPLIHAETHGESSNGLAFNNRNHDQNSQEHSAHLHSSTSRHLLTDINTGGPNTSTNSSRHAPTHENSYNHQYQRSHEQVGFDHEQKHPSMQPYYSKFQKAPPPTFSGERSDWPEFRAIWRRHGDREYPNDEERAWALKRSLKGQASEHVKAIFVTQPNAYERIWDRLDHIYSDISHNIQDTFAKLNKLKVVTENDLKGMVNFVNEVEMCYSSLGEIGQLEAVTLNQIDSLCDLLPVGVRKQWLRIYRQLPQESKLHPFHAFMQYLEDERDDSLRLAEKTTSKKLDANFKQNEKKTQRSMHIQSHSEPIATTSYYNQIKCVMHQQSQVSHITQDCREFHRLSLTEKLDALKKARVCFRCFRKHKRDHCQMHEACKTCNKTNHHHLLCRINPENTNKSKVKTQSTNELNDNSQQKPQVTSVSNKTDTGRSTSLLPIMQAKVSGTNSKATILFDGGSDCSYIREGSAKNIKARRLGPVTLDVVTMGGNTTQYTTHQYEVPLVATDGSLTKVVAYGMNQITGQVSQLNTEVIKNLFPYFDIGLLSRHSDTVDILLGNDYYGLHPKQELSKNGKHLSIMEGELGICLQGSHPRLAEATEIARDCTEAYNVSAVIKVVQTNFARINLHLTSNLAFTKPGESEIETFIRGEQLGTEVNPKCGGCKCTKCPIVGHTYSFQEQQELDMIRSNLKYDQANQIWITKYPWIKDPNTLPNNYFSALATLERCEKTLLKDSEWAKVYNEQIEDMVYRNVARKISPREIKDWNGAVFYISHLAVSNPKSETTPVRIVFNSSQSYKGVSLNSALAKGPDAYLNNIIGILLRWRENKIAFVGDIRKMYNSIYIEEVEQHCHRFLWRNLDTGREPDTYIIQRVNMGDRPAGAISSEAIYKTATLFEDSHPRVAEILRHSTYVDDIVDSTTNVQQAENLAMSTEEVLSKVGFNVKGWQLSGEGAARKKADIPPNNQDEKFTTRVLGVVWNPKSDDIRVSSSLNFSEKKRGRHTEENLTANMIPVAIPLKLTRRSVLEQVMKVYDPLGLVSPFTLQAKCYLRDTWTLNLKWDEPLPEEMRQRWLNYFEQLVHLPNQSFDRCLRPDNAIGQPLLVIFSDGSETAYGFTAYIRWELEDGSFFVRLVCSKARIAPMKKLSIPRMELNAAVMSKRARKVLEDNMRFKFERVVHLIDSETVLSMLNKLSTRFKTYEGVRVGEIQSANNGDMSSWFWINGKSNIADWLTRPKLLQELNKQSEWWQGPQFMYTDFDSWEIKPSKSYANDECSVETFSSHHKISKPENKVGFHTIIDYYRFSDVKKLQWVVARLISVFKHKSFKGGSTIKISTEILCEACDMLLKDVQKIMTDLDKQNKGQYKSLKPVKTQNNNWIIGSRMALNNPLSADKPQWLVPTNHRYTRLLMKEAHEMGGHRGRDSTLARFRHSYWAPQGAKLAKSVKNACQLCRVRDARLLTQEMGLLPVERLKQAPPFNSTMIDLFGPYLVRGEVQKRVSGKAYGVIFTDLYSRATHIEMVFGYDTQSFVLALMRFTSIRGWPEKIFSDPGSQLVGAEKEVTKTWREMDKQAIYKACATSGTQWIFGPADSPWHQGAVEALVKAAKRGIKMAINSQRMSPTELLTIGTEVSNMLNERPLGTLPSSDAEINILTPNCLLLGRAHASNPGGWAANHSFKTQLELINNVSDRFWKHWSELYAPTMVKQQKWFKSDRNIQPGDIVAIADQNNLRGKYHIAKVSEVFPSKDGKIRRVALAYKNFKQGEKVNAYKGANDTKIMRSVQRLALLVPVDAVGGVVRGGED